MVLDKICKVKLIVETTQIITTFICNHARVLAFDEEKIEVKY